VLQAFGLGFGSHAITVVAAASPRKWRARDTRGIQLGPDCSLFLACIRDCIPNDLSH
jgi:hypothetical protein